MNPVHWVRSRQEQRELAYWLAFFAYNLRDRSFNNHLYLAYLIVFFTGWGFMTLTLFASYLVRWLQVLHPANPSLAGAVLEMLMLGGWSIYSLWQACRRSPVFFSAEDASLICQTPLNRRQIVLRWLLMPWLKSAIPFWLAAITLGFATSQFLITGTIEARAIWEYAGAGWRSWMAILPVHLTLYGLIWSVGVYRLQKGNERNWFVWPVMMVSFLIFSVFLIISFWPAGIIFRSVALLPFLAGFGQGSPGLALLTGAATSAAALGILCRISNSFSLNLAAQETQELELIHSALQYGFTTYAQDLQTKRRIGMGQAASRLPAGMGAAAIVWKDILQSRRKVQVTDLLVWLAIFGAMFCWPLMSDLGSRALVFVVWMDQIAKVTSRQIRDDLALWPLSRQLPIPSGKIIFASGAPATFLCILISYVGLISSSAWLGLPINSMAALLPGITATAAGFGIWDVIRHSRSTLLLTGSVPDVGAGGVLVGLLFAFIPLLVTLLLKGPFGLILSVLITILQAMVAYALGVRAYQNIPG